MINYLDLFGNNGIFNKPYVIEKLTIKSIFHVGQNLSMDEVIDLFKHICSNANKGGYYVGITCAPKRREGEHEAAFLAVIKCQSVDDANNLERELSKIGFDAGKHVGNVHNEDSTKVYIYKKTDSTTE